MNSVTRLSSNQLKMSTFLEFELNVSTDVRANGHFIYTLGIGKYKACLKKAMLDICPSDEKPISSLGNKRFDWTVRFNSKGYRIISDVPLGEVPSKTTILIGSKFSLTRRFSSFSLLDDFHSDEGAYHYSVNIYETPQKNIGIVFSGWQNESNIVDFAGGIYYRSWFPDRKYYRDGLVASGMFNWRPRLTIYPTETVSRLSTYKSTKK